MGAIRARLPDGRRWHFQHGPIDLVLQAWGDPGEVERASAQAWARFQTILDELVTELPLLRREIGDELPRGSTARRMYRACLPHRPVFVTPMAAVAGAVADEVLDAMVDGRGLGKAYVNNGGDVALHLTAGQSFDAGLVFDLDHPALDGAATITFEDPVRGVATSGRGGRSFSRGIADSVTVLARNAATADAAATLIANAVDIDDPAIERRPADELDPDSDLGPLPVTVAVGDLSGDAVQRALGRGVAAANRLYGAGAIAGALLTLAGKVRIAGALPLNARHERRQLP